MNEKAYLQNKPEIVICEWKMKNLDWQLTLKYVKKKTKKKKRKRKIKAHSVESVQSESFCGIQWKAVGTFNI